MSISDDAARNGETAPTQEADAASAMEEQSASTVADTQPDGRGSEPSRGSRKRRRVTVAATVVAVVVAATAGMFVWHEQPSFCNAICHTPMNPYLPTYEASIDGSGVDKWGNAVEDASGMLAPVHATAGKTCMDCHVPTLSEQMTEGVEWVTGSYGNPLGERTLDQLVAARGLENSEEFCMNDTCHNFSREDLEKKTAWMGEVNPHSSRHGDQDCGLCHKAHRASVMYCTQCHTEAVVPDGWVSYQESEQLLAQSGTVEG